MVRLLKKPDLETDACGESASIQVAKDTDYGVPVTPLLAASRCHPFLSEISTAIYGR
jgi:hypothetical protein